ncbi:alpha/beta hydrolase fold protein-like protein [Rhexocercosporidium sp. MPI-PUGE-AT-0058]|nr:alpha/beta hydrolase fold protein-like protein [Rhexocercosporidium sp. MPI-PUGE-AT-0058]
MATSPVHKALISGTPSTPSEVSIAYIDASPSSSAKAIVLLIHGYPETSYQFRHVIPLFVERGYRVIAPDYRGAGHSSKPREGYNKVTLATDLYELLTKHLGIKEKVHVVGHDIGGMVAHAYAARFPEGTKSVAWGECPLPGTKEYDNFLLNSGVWHFHFHWQADLPEFLTTGQEEQYIKHFYDRLTSNPHAITPTDLAYYTQVFKQPGAMRAGFDLYRGFHQDVHENRAWVKEKGKCKVPTLTMNGENSSLVNIAEAQAKEFYENVSVATVDGSGHWCAEENPEDFVEKVVKFVEKNLD